LKTIVNVALKLESNKYCETTLFSKMDKYYETDGVYVRGFVFPFNATCQPGAWLFDIRYMSVSFEKSFNYY